MAKYLEIKGADFSQSGLMIVNIIRNGPIILLDKDLVYIVAEGATSIYYTTDGTTPTTGSTTYKQPFEVSNISVVRAFAVIDGKNTAITTKVVFPYIIYEFTDKINEGEHPAGVDYYSRSRFHYNIPNLIGGVRYKLQVVVSKPIPSTRESSSSASTFAARLTSGNTVNTGTDLYIAGTNPLDGVEVEFIADDTKQWLYLYFDTTGISTVALPDDSYSFVARILRV